MTLNEKVGQLLCPLGWPMYEKKGNKVDISPLFKQRMDAQPLGSLWAVLRADPWTQKTLVTGLNPRLAAEALNKIQRYAVNNTRLGIPILIAEECPHGHMAIGTTVMPTALAQASTFNKALMHRMGEVIALEARLQGANIGYGPVIDIAREPRWSRMEETFGEDPYLTGVLATQVVRGMDLLSSAPRQMYLQELFGFPHPEYAHVPMLLAPDGRRLSKRDKDLDLGVLRQRITPETLIGTLAFASGLIDQNLPISAQDLSKEFSWNKLRGDSIYLDASRL